MRYKLQVAISLLLLPFIPIIVGRWYDFALFIGGSAEESLFSTILFCAAILAIYIINSAICMIELDKE